jgi:hypothetical protein
LPLMTADAFAVEALTTPSAEIRALGDAVQLQGSVRFRYWGFHAYDIQLWTLPGFNEANYEAHPLALSITYARQIDMQDLVERSLLEIGRQAPVLPQQAQQWRQALLKAFRDVQPGDRLTGIFRPPHQASFYFNGQLTTSLQINPLVPRFFGIWLSEQTSQPSLRKALLRNAASNGVVNGW